MVDIMWIPYCFRVANKHFVVQCRVYLCFLIHVFYEIYLLRLEYSAAIDINKPTNCM